MSTMPGAVEALPMLAASRPRRTFRLSDSWGERMAGVARSSVRTGWAGSDMSSMCVPDGWGKELIGTYWVVS